jgi:hypothetical protein
LGKETTQKYQLGNLRSTWADNINTELRIDRLSGSEIDATDPKQYPTEFFLVLAVLNIVFGYHNISLDFPLSHSCNLAMNTRGWWWGAKYTMGIRSLNLTLSLLMSYI